MFFTAWMGVVAAFGYALMVTVNALANILPINGVTSGGVSDSFPNLFAPAGLTFSIWGVIYLLLGASTMFQLGFFQGGVSVGVKNLARKIGVRYLLTSLLNSAWIFAWHYGYIALSVGIMFALLAALISIAETLRKSSHTQKEWFFLRLPFQVYFGWITIAAIANVSVLLVSLQWSRFGLSEVFWTVVMLIVGAVIGVLTAWRHRSMAYAAVLIWAYFGIFWKHATVFAGMYPAVLLTAGMGMTLFADLIAVIGCKRKWRCI